MATDLSDVFWELVNHILSVKEYEYIRTTHAFQRIHHLVRHPYDNGIMLQWDVVAPWTFSSAMHILEGQPITPGMTTYAYGLYFRDAHVLFVGMADMLQRLGDPRGIRLRTCIARMKDIWQMEEVRELLEGHQLV